MKFKTFILGVGIFVVYALALFQGLETFYPTPQYDDYCDFHAGVREPASCPNLPYLQTRIEACLNSKGDFVYEYDSNSVFIISIIIGVIVFIAGLFLLYTEPVGSALMAGGIWSVFFGVVKNWRNFSDSWRFLLLFVLLIVLIWVALRLNKNHGHVVSKIKGKFRR